MVALNNVFSGLPTRPLPDELFESILQTGRFCLKRIISTGQSTPANEWYDQADNEWCILLQGAAALRFEGQAELIELKPGDYIHIPAHKRHQVAWTKPDEPTVWLALYYHE